MSSAATQRFIRSSKPLQRAAELVRQDVFGHVPQLNARSGVKKAKIGLTGPYLEKYYPESINTFARKVTAGWETEQEEYRRVKQLQRRRRGKGPPKKGSGASSKKK